MFAAGFAGLFFVEVPLPERSVQDPQIGDLTDTESARGEIKDADVSFDFSTREGRIQYEWKKATERCGLQMQNFDDITRQCVAALPVGFRTDFYSFGERMASGKDTVSLTTLCSGTDGVVDALKVGQGCCIVCVVSHEMDKCAVFVPA